MFVEVAREGLALMIVDLSIQLSLTITIYVAASQSFEDAYKLSAVQSAYWTFGPAYMMGFTVFLKLLGAQMIARREFSDFVKVFSFAAILTTSLAGAAIIAAHVKRVPVGYFYGESACIFATQKECAPVYANIFEGPDQLASVFEVFGPTVGLQLVFLLMRAGLSTCHDFMFMAKSSAFSFVVVYIPAILVARYAIQRAAAYYVAMYLPHFVLIAIFGVRMVSHLRKLLNGQEGPWTKHGRRASVAPEDAAPDVKLLFPDIASDGTPSLNPE